MIYSYIPAFSHIVVHLRGHLLRLAKLKIFLLISHPQTLTQGEPPPPSFTLTVLLNKWEQINHLLLSSAQIRHITVDVLWQVNTAI